MDDKMFKQNSPAAGDNLVNTHHRDRHWDLSK